MESIACNTVLLPDNIVTDRSFALSERLEKHGSFFTLKDGIYFVHVSLYMAQLKLDSIPHICSILSEIAYNTPKIKLVARGYHQEGGYIDVDYERTKLIDSLQMTVIGSLNPIRDGLRKKDQARLETAQGLELENIKQYGYRSIGDLFAPHLTLTRFHKVEPIDISNLPDINKFNTTFTKLGLFEMGDNGTCVRKIAEFNLVK